MTLNSGLIAADVNYIRSLNHYYIDAHFYQVIAVDFAIVKLVMKIFIRLKSLNHFYDSFRFFQNDFGLLEFDCLNTYF